MSAHRRGKGSLSSCSKLARRIALLLVAAQALLASWLVYRRYSPRCGQSDGASVAFFTLPKPMRGDFKSIQLNAWRSWARLSPPPVVVLTGDEPGVHEWCGQMGQMACFLHGPGVEYNWIDVPLLRSIFSSARRQRPKDDVYVFINSDIVLGPMFMTALQSAHTYAQASGRPFLMVGRRTEMRTLPDISTLGDHAWEELFSQAEHSPGGMQTAIDYFAFSAPVYGDTLPDLSLCFTWDNWLLAHAFRRGAVVIDASSIVRAIHQHHEYAPRKDCFPWNSTERVRNRKVAKAAGGWDRGDITYATHVLDNDVQGAPMVRPKPAFPQTGAPAQLDRRKLPACDRWKYICPP